MATQRPINVVIKGDYNDKDVKRAIRDLQSLQKQGKTTSRGMAGMTTSMKAWGAATAAAIGAVAVKMGVDAVKAGSDLNESISKVGVVFGKNSQAIQKWSETSATSFGLTQQAALEAAGTYGNLFQAFGIGQQKAQQMSTTLVQLAADLASFNNTSVDDAIQALRSGLSGETEPLKRYGVALTDVRLREEAKNLAIYDGVGVLDAAQKSQAAYSLILKDTALAQGDFARTSDGAANQMRILSASMGNLQTAFGSGFLQGFSTMAETGDKLAVSMAELKPVMEAAGQAAGEAASGFVKLASGVGDALGEMNKPIQEQSWWAKSLSYTWHILSTDLTTLGQEVVSGAKLNEEHTSTVNTASTAANRYRYALQNQWTVQRDVTGATETDTAAQARATRAALDRSSAVERLRTSLDKLDSRRSAARQRIQIKRLLAEGPTATGERKVMKDGKEVTERFVTKQDKRLFALDVADARAGLADTLFENGMGSDRARAAAARQFALGRKNIRGLNLGPGVAQNYLATPNELLMTKGQSAASLRYQGAGTMIVIEKVEVTGDNPAQVVEKAQQWVRLKALGRGANSGAHAGGGYRR